MQFHLPDELQEELNFDYALGLLVVIISLFLFVLLVAYMIQAMIDQAKNINRTLTPNASEVIV